MGDRNKIENNDIVDICGHKLESFDDLVNNFNKPIESDAAALGNNESLKKLSRVAKGREGNGVFLNGHSILKEETRSQRQKARLLSREFKTSSTRGIGSLQTELARLSVLSLTAMLCYHLS